MTVEAFRSHLSQVMRTDERSGYAAQLPLPILSQAFCMVDDWREDGILNEPMAGDNE